MVQQQIPLQGMMDENLRMISWIDNMIKSCDWGLWHISWQDFFDRKDGFPKWLCTNIEENYNKNYVKPKSMHVVIQKVVVKNYLYKLIHSNKIAFVSFFYKTIAIYFNQKLVNIWDVVKIWRNLKKIALDFIWKYYY